MPGRAFRVGCRSKTGKACRDGPAVPFQIQLVSSPEDKPPVLKTSLEDFNAVTCNGTGTTRSVALPAEELKSRLKENVRVPNSLSRFEAGPVRSPPLRCEGHNDQAKLPRLPLTGLAETDVKGSTTVSKKNAMAGSA